MRFSQTLREDTIDHGGDQDKLNGNLQQHWV